MKQIHLLPVMLAALIFSFTRCQNNHSLQPDSGFSDYISAYTGGIISEHQSIRIVLTSPADEAQMQKKTEELFSFTPAIKGTTGWISPSILEFRPEKLKSGTIYKGKFHLSGIIGTSDRKHDTFSFSFTVAEKDAVMTAGEIFISTSASDTASISGNISLSDDISPENLRKMILGEVDGMKWPAEKTEIIPGRNLRFWSVLLKDIPLKKQQQDVQISFDGSSEGFKKKREITATLPGSGDFRILSVLPEEDDSPCIVVTFSQPLAPDLEPEGLIETNAPGSHMDIHGNLLKIYHQGTDQEEISVKISDLVRSLTGERLKESHSVLLKDCGLKPAVKILNKGTILPDSRHAVLPFRAVNLSAIDFSVIKIFENNILMFLQENELSEDAGIRRSGRLIYKNTIRLDSGNGRDLHHWNDYSIDLSGLFRQEPGAIYRIRLTFRKEYSLYGKELQQNSDNDLHEGLCILKTDHPELEEEIIWDSPYPYLYEDSYDWRNYNWKDRNDPETPSYYMESSRFPSCNLMSTRLGIIAKSATERDGKIWITVTDLLSAQPIKSASVTAYSYQLQKIGEAVTDGRGRAVLEPEGKAFLITASHNGSVSYLKVNDGNEKPLSRFDIGGKETSEGVKGFIYGERGLWKPGDTLHLTLMIDPGNERIPENHPVTLEVYTPQGQFYEKQICREGKDGIYTFAVKTDEEDPTGIWNCHFRLGGSTFHKSVRLENLRPNRLDLSLRFSEKTLQAGGETRMDLTSRWLTGPAAGGLQATVEMILKKGETTFSSFPKYCFELPTSRFTETGRTIFQGQLDSAGKTSAQIHIPKGNNAPGMLEAIMICRVTEPGGEQSITSETLSCSPYNAYVGIKLPEGNDGFLETDTEHQIAIISTDRNGRPLSGRELEYNIYRLEWSWWWENRNTEFDSYINGTAAGAVASGTLVSGNGPVFLPFRIDYPQWGRYLILVRDTGSGHVSGGTLNVDWPSWRGRSEKRDPDALTMLTFSTDRKSYKKNEEATLFVPAARNGKALVSFENGSGVLSSVWVNTDNSEETPYRFRITEEMAPNFYIHITLLQPHGTSGNDLPLRMYGVIPVFVENEESRLEPIIDAPSVIHPQEDFTIHIHEKSGKAMTYTLAIVDEGLLDITSFKTPDPWNEFYSREALGVKTWDLYDEVIGAYSGRFSPMFSIGGDEAGRIGRRKENRFAPIVQFYGPLSLKKGETASKVIRLPMYVGSVRIMAVAAKDGAYGKASKEVPVKSPLMILPSAPDRLGTEEEFILPVNLFMTEGNRKEAEINISISGPATLIGPRSAKLQFHHPGDQTARFSIRSGKEEGTAEIHIQAICGEHSVTQTLPLRIQNRHLPAYRTKQTILKKGETEKLDYQPFTTDQQHWGRIELSSFPAVPLETCFETALRCPDYSLAQTLSRGLVLLHLKDFVSRKSRSTLPAVIPDLLQKLYVAQSPDGGFPVWPEDSRSDERLTSLAGLFLTEAAAAGFDVNPDVAMRWKQFQKNCSRNYRNMTKESSGKADLIQAFRLYTLAQAADPDLGGMNRLKENGPLSPAAAWRLAATYALTGKKNIATSIISNIHPEQSGTPSYGDLLEQQNAAAEALILTGDIEAAIRAAADLSSSFTDWGTMDYHTALTAATMNHLAEEMNTGLLEAAIHDGKDSTRIRTAEAVVRHELNTRNGSARIRNLSEGALYLTTTLRTSEASSEAASSGGLTMKMTFTDADGNEADPGEFRVGSDVTALLSLRNNDPTRHFSSLALSVPTPSGWYALDGREEITLFHTDLPAGSEKTFKIRYHVSYAGTFKIPSATCSDEEDPSIRARTASRNLSVKY